MLAGQMVAPPIGLVSISYSCLNSMGQAFNRGATSVCLLIIFLLRNGKNDDDSVFLLLASALVFPFTRSKANECVVRTRMCPCERVCARVA